MNLKDLLNNIVMLFVVYVYVLLNNRLYFFQLQNEITEVFEQLQINEEQLNADKSMTTSNQTTGTASTTSIGPIKINDVPETNIKIPSSVQKSVGCSTPITPPTPPTNHSVSSPSLLNTNRTLPKYKTQRSGDEWAVDIMDELNNLVKNELQNLKRNEELLATQILMGTTTDSNKITCNDEINDVSWIFFSISILNVF